MLKISASLLCICYCIYMVTADCKTGNSVLKTGEKYKMPNKCFEATCNEDGSLGGSGCSTFALPPNSNCKVQPEDPTKPFPDCCSKPIC